MILYGNIKNNFNKKAGAIITKNMLLNFNKKTYILCVFTTVSNQYTTRYLAKFMSYHPQNLTFIFGFVLDLIKLPRMITLIIVQALYLDFIAQTDRQKIILNWSIWFCDLKRQTERHTNILILLC